MGRQLTITIDDEVAARLDDLAEKSGAPVEELASHALRKGLPRPEKPVPAKPYVFPPGPMLELKPGINIDNIEELLDEIEGPWRR